MTTTSTMTKKQERIANLLKINNYSDNWNPEEFFDQGQYFLKALKAGKVWLIIHNVTPSQSAEVSFRIADQSPKECTGRQWRKAIAHTALMKTILCAKRKRNSHHILIENNIDNELQRAVLSGLQRWGFITKEQEVKLNQSNLLIIAR